MINALPIARGWNLILYVYKNLFRQSIEGVEIMFEDTSRGNFFSAVGASDGPESDFGFGAASELVRFSIYL